MTFITTILLFLFNLSVIGYVAHRSRVAIRGLWARGENLQDQIQAAKMTWNASNNQIYSDLASHIHGKPIQFRSQHGEDVYLWNYFDRKCTGLCYPVPIRESLSRDCSCFAHSEMEHGLTRQRRHLSTGKA